MLLPVLALALVLAGGVYLVSRIRRFGFVKRLAGGRGWAEVAVSALALAAVIAPWLAVNVTAMAVVFMHLLVFWLLADLVSALAGRLRRGESRRDGSPRSQRYLAGAAAVAFTAVYLAVGWFLAHHIYAVHVSVTTDKDLGGGVRVAVMSDCHLGITLDGEEFARLCERIEAEEPDAVVVVGDFVDDDTDREDMVRACEALGELDCPGGVFFVYGNHDTGYFGYRDFSAEDLRSALLDAGVQILEDQSALAEGRFWVVGRRDRSQAGRAEARELTEGLDSSKFILMLDHQPNDYDGEAASGADLVVSGHTHGGHIFPAGQIGLLMGANDRVYGTEVRGGTTFLVTSGVSGWVIPFKTGTISEYVIIDITEE